MLAKESGRSVTAQINYILSMQPTGSKVVKSQIRLPAELHAQLLEAASESQRSMNAELVNRLLESFE